MLIHMTSGIGKAPTKLAAFDAALSHAGIANYNLIYLSSVIPENTTVKIHDEGGIPKNEMPGKWGDRLYVVMAEKRLNAPNAEAWAGIGWVQENKTKKGLFVEHVGNSEREVRKDIEQSLEALMATRNVQFGDIKMKVVGATCTHHPISVLVSAVYQASDWQNGADLV
jgi:arginine decarboxylase